MFALALGYEDINDHDRLRDDSLLALALDGPDLTGQSRRRERDRGHALAGSSTLNRLELGTPLEADEDRYKKVVASTEQIDDLLVDLFLDMHETLPERIVLDVDATDDQLHGQQEGRFYHGYYRHYCYLPLYITCGEHVLCARLRTAQVEAAEGTVAELERIVRRIRQRWPQAVIVVRGDAGFCRDTLMTWCEQRGVDYVLGLARNSRLLGQIRRQLRQAGKACARTGQAARRFRDFCYRTLKSWGRQRRVVGKAEWLPGQRGANPRFVVTSLSREEVAGPKRHDPEQDPEGGRGGEGDGAQGMAAFLLDVPAQGTLREHREAADGSEAKGLPGMSVADGRTGARWRAEGRGQAEVRPDCAPGGQQACQEGHSSLDLGLAASWNRFGYPGWQQISGIRLHLRPIGDCCSSGWAPCAALVRYPGSRPTNRRRRNRRCSNQRRCHLPTGRRDRGSLDAVGADWNGLMLIGRHQIGNTTPLLEETGPHGTVEKRRSRRVSIRRLEWIENCICVRSLYLQVILNQILKWIHNTSSPGP